MPTYGFNLNAAHNSIPAGFYSTGITLAANEYVTGGYIDGTCIYTTGETLSNNDLICTYWLRPANDHDSGKQMLTVRADGTIQAGSTINTAVTTSWETGLSVATWAGQTLDIDFITGNSTIRQTDSFPFHFHTSYAHNVSITTVAGGKVTASATNLIKAGATVTLTPKANSGYTFAGWNTAPSVTFTATNKFTMPDSNVTVTGIFNKNKYRITAAVSPAGTGTVTAPSEAEWGSTVSLSQEPASGYEFDHWEVSNGQPVSYNSFEMTAEDVTVTAYYVPTHTLTWETNSTIRLTQDDYNVVATMTGRAVDSLDETVSYYLYRGNTQVGVFDQNTASATITDEDIGSSITYKIVAVSDPSGLSLNGASASITIVPVHQTLGYFDGTSFVECIPYYKTENGWVEVVPYWNNGSDWIQGSMT